MQLLFWQQTRHVCTIIATHPDLVARVANNEMTLLQHTLEIICPGPFHSSSVSSSSMYSVHNIKLLQLLRVKSWLWEINMSWLFMAVQLIKRRGLWTIYIAANFVNYLDLVIHCSLVHPSTESDQRKWLQHNTQHHHVLPIDVFRNNFLWTYQCTEVHFHSIAHWPGRFYCSIPGVCSL